MVPGTAAEFQDPAWSPPGRQIVEDGTKHLAIPGHATVDRRRVVGADLLEELPR
jgi:hypothetical protein